MAERLLSVVAPALNEEGSIAEFCSRVSAVVASSCPGWRLEIIVVDDGSTDATATKVGELHQADHRIGLVALSRNFGHEAAILAGMDNATGDAVVVMDSDLQHPPEIIPDMIAALDAGHDVVHARRERDDSEGALKKWSAILWYRILGRMVGDAPVPPADVSDFRLVSRRAADAFLRLRESGRYGRGLFAWIGFAATEVPYRRAARHAGASKYGLGKLVKLALDGLTSFSTMPLRLAVYLGLLVLVLAGLYLCYVIMVGVFGSRDVPGWASTLGSVLFLGGVQLVMLGIIGEYLARLFNEAKNRPPYIVRDSITPAAGKASKDQGQ